MGSQLQCVCPGGPKANRKTWRVILKKERYCRKCELDDRDQLEATVGREVVISHEQDRERWEAMYRDRSPLEVDVESGGESSPSVRSSPRVPAVVDGSSPSDIELAELPSIPVKYEDELYPSDTSQVDSPSPIEDASSLFSTYAAASSASSLDAVNNKKTIGKLHYNNSETTSENAWLTRADIKDQMHALRADDDVDASVGATGDENEPSELPFSTFTTPFRPTNYSQGVLPDSHTQSKKQLVARYLRQRSSASSHGWSTASWQNVVNEAKASVSTLGNLEPLCAWKLSKEALNERTNEWAKQVPGIDLSDLEAVSRSSSPGTHVDQTSADEATESVCTEGHEPSMQITQTSLHMRTEEQGDQLTQVTASTISLPELSDETEPVYAFPSSKVGIASNQQQSSIAISGHGFALHSRHVSAPPGSEAVVKSPVKDTTAAPSSHRSFSLPMDPGSAANLLDERNRRLRAKPTSVSFNLLPMAPAFKINPLQNRGYTHEDDLVVAQALPTEYERLRDNDNMTLAERKALLKEQQLYSRQGHWRQPHGSTTSVMAIRQIAVHDGQQHNRNDTVGTAKEHSTVEWWHKSLQEQAAFKQPRSAEETAWQAKVSGHWQSQQQQKFDQHERMQRQAAMDDAARNGYLNNVHKEALRKMQAKVVHNAT